MDIESIPNNFWLQDSSLIEPFNAVMTNFLATAIFDICETKKIK
jgi:hypothetical protein